MTPTISNSGDNKPRFEFYPLDSPKLRTVPIQEFPFIIGRAESASLRINSTSVSREHAEVEKTPTGFRLRDLNSTNGTSVNGQQIKDSPLADGDSVSIADIELTFLCSSMGRLQRTMTRPLPGRKQPVTPLGTPAELVASRGLHEALLFQTIPLEWCTLVDKDSNAPQATTVRIVPPLSSWMKSADSKDSTAVAARLESLAWQIAAERVDSQLSAANLQSLAKRENGEKKKSDSKELTGVASRLESLVGRLAANREEDSSPRCGLLLGVTQRESLNERLMDTLDRVAEALPRPRQIGIAVNWEWVTATTEALRLCGKLRQHGFLLAYDDFSGGGGCIESMDQAPPDYLLLSEKVVRGAADQPRHLQRLEIMQANCAAHQIKTVLPQTTSREDADACSQLGIQLVQQNHRSATPDDAQLAAMV